MVGLTTSVIIQEYDMLNKKEELLDVYNYTALYNYTFRLQGI